MKKLLHSGLAALVMLFMTGFIYAAPQLKFTGITSDNKYGRYVPVIATLTDNGTQLQNFEVYYCTVSGVTPSKDQYQSGNESTIGIWRVIASGTTAEIVLEDVTAYFQAIAYPAGTYTASNVFALDMSALDVEKPEFVPATPAFGGLEVDLNTIVKIKDNAGGAEIFYSTDGETTPLRSVFGKDPNVLKYDDATGIKITKAMTVRAIAFKQINGQWAGSEMLRSRFNLAKPRIKIELSSSEYTIEQTAPTVNLTIPDGVTLGTQPGNVAVKLSCQSSGFSQIITQNGTALDMSKADAANREDEWIIQCSLVKGENTAAAYTGDVEITPEIISIEILKDGERPAVPVFSVPSGKVYKGTKVAILCATPGATIYYTTGDEEISTLYKGEITINQDCFIRAMAEKDGLSSFRTGVARAAYTVENDPMPELSLTVTPAAGSQITAGTEITVTPSVAVDKILFKLYEKAEDVDKDENFNNTATEYTATVKPVPTEAMPIVRVGLLKDQQWKYFSYVYSFQAGSVTPPTPPDDPDKTEITLMFNPASGSTVDAGTSVSISASSKSVEDIFYMMFASEEEAKETEWDQNQAHLYTDEYQPALSTEATTIKATYTLDGETRADTFFYATYDVVDLISVELLFRPASGSVVENGTEINVTANQETEVYYVVYPDSMASVEAAPMFIADSKEISEDGKPVITRGHTFLKCGAFDASAGTMKYFFASYRIKGELEEMSDTVKTPEFSIPAGEVEKGTKVEITCATPDAMICYTLNGDEPTVMSLLYSEPIEINEPVTIKAVAFKTGMKKSQVNTAAYTIKSVANEAKELAGVRIYPNPNEGVFNLSVPVDAEVEVFTTNGVMIKHLNVTAGVNAMRLENSGIYFVRVNANKQVAIKKVVIR